MISVQGYAGRKVAVLGLGRSGMATVRALKAGGAEVLAWDDSAEAQARLESEGLSPTKLTADWMVWRSCPRQSSPA